MALKDLIRIKKSNNSENTEYFSNASEAEMNEYVSEKEDTGRLVVFDNESVMSEQNKNDVYNTSMETSQEFETEPRMSLNRKAKKKEYNERPEETTEKYETKYETNMLCAPVNVVPFDWSKEFLYSVMSRRINMQIVKNMIFLLFVAGILISITITGRLLVMEKNNHFTNIFNQNVATVSEYTSVAENIAAYKHYTKILNNPSVYTQFWGMSYLLSRNGFLTSTVAFSKIIPPSVSGKIGVSTFAVETGSSMESIDLRGVWVFEGMISPRVEAVNENDWQMNFSRQVQTLFGKQDVRTYTSVIFTEPGAARVSSSVMLIILLWK